MKVFKNLSFLNKYKLSNSIINNCKQNTNILNYLNICYFCNSSNLNNNYYGFKYPDQIIEDIKKYLSDEKKEIKIKFSDLEEDIINNIHFFDVDQYTDVMTLLGKSKEGSLNLWNLLERKFFDYEYNYIQVRDIFNTNVANSSLSSRLQYGLLKELSKYDGAKDTNEVSTYKLFF